MVRIKAAIQSGSLMPIVDWNKFDLIDFIGNSGKTLKLHAAIVTHVVHGHRRLKTGNFLPIPSGEPHLSRRLALGQRPPVGTTNKHLLNDQIEFK